MNASVRFLVAVTCTLLLVAGTEAGTTSSQKDNAILHSFARRPAPLMHAPASYPKSAGRSTSSVAATLTVPVPYATIQSAVDAASNGDIISVAAGTYAENLVVNKSVSLVGPNANINPNTGIRGAEAIIVPATSDPDPYSVTGVTTVYISGSNVTMNGFTVDGDNPGLTSSVNINGANIDAVEAIGGYDGITGVDIKNNILKNCNYAGIDFYTISATPTSGNAIHLNKFDNILPSQFGIGVILYNNCYGQVTNNVMTRVRVGVQTGNFSAANPGVAGSISNNTIESARLGLFYNLHYSGASPFTVANNTFTTYSGALNNWGIEISSQQQTVSATFSNNNITGAYVGVEFWNDPTSSTMTVSGGTISGCTYGVRVDNYDGYSSNGDPTIGAVSGVTIQNSVTAAVDVKDNSLNSNNATAHANVLSGTTFTNNPFDVAIDGADASASVDAGIAPIKWWLNTVIQSVVNSARAGDVVNVVAGSYPEQVSVDKALTLLGANAWIAGNGARGAESVIDGGGVRSGFQFAANNVIINGFKVQGCVGTFNSGVWMDGSKSGGQLLNCVIKDNVIGLYPDCNGATTIKRNLFDGNNRAGAAGGAGIYVDLTNGLVVDSNEFKNHAINSAVIFASSATGVHQNVTFTHNYIHDNNADNSMVYCISIHGGLFQGNTITQPGTRAIKLTGDCTNINILNNTLDNNGYGVRVTDDGYGFGNNANISIHYNTLGNCTDDGVENNSGYTGIIDATNNSWGSIFGPNDPVGTIEVPTSPAPSVANMKNTIPAGGLGSPVSENVNYYPWTGNNDASASGGGVSIGAYGSPTSNGVFAGIDPGALDAVDPHDTVAPPPPPSNYVYLYFLLDPGNALPNYSVDVKKDEASLAAAAKAWQLKVLSDLTSHMITMELPVSPLLPPGFKPVLYNLGNTDYVSLRSTSFYTFTTPPTVTPTNFRLLIGDSTKPAVTVTAPNGGEFLVVGTPYNITWTSSDGTGVLRHYIYLSTDGGSTYAPIAANDSTNGNVHSFMWTPSSAASAAVIKVVARDSVMNEQTDVSDHTFQILASNSISYNAQAGWNLVSPAMLQGDMSPAGVFGDDYGVTPYFTFQFSPTAGYSVPSTLNMGQGYWLGSNSAKTITAVGTPVSSASLLLAAGFNIIGDPFAIPEPKDSLKFTMGLVTKNMTDAATAGWLSNVLYGYAGTSYFVEGSSLAVWNGYWVPMLLNGITVSYTPVVGVPPPKVAPVETPATPSHWSVELAAAITIDGNRYEDRIASFGVREDATEKFNGMYDAPRPPRSPSKDYVEVAFPARSQGYPAGFDSYARDYRNPQNAAWTFTVRSSAEGTVTLTWDHTSIAALPADVKIELFDGSTHTATDMKKVDSYSYEQHGTTHEFTVNSEKHTLPQHFELTQNYPNPFNPTTKITYALPYDAKVQVSVYNFLGERVADLVNETLTAGYHEVVFDASRLASGMYFYRINAAAENGASFSSSKKMLLIK